MRTTRTSNANSPANTPTNPGNAAVPRSGVAGRERAPRADAPGAGALARPAMRPQAKAELNQYVTGLHALGRAPSGNTLQRLASANASVDRTRAKLPKGPGNTFDMHAHRSPDPKNATVLAREVSERLEQSGHSRFACAVVAALETQGGNCREFAFLAVHEHLGHTDPKASVVLRTPKGVDHLWAQEVPPPGAHDAEPVVLDAWAKGPSVLLRDATHPHFNADSHRVFRPEDKADLDDEVTSARFSAFLDRRITNAERDQLSAFGTPMYEQHTLSRLPTIGPAFARSVADRLNVQIDPGTSHRDQHAAIGQGLANLKAARAALAGFDDTAARSVLSAPALVKATREWAQAAQAQQPDASWARCDDDGDDSDDSVSDTSTSPGSDLPRRHSV